MEQFIQDVLQDKGENYILPFFWQHGESEAVLRDYMRAIHQCGIGAVCVEARPHPDFAGPGWWHDLDIILDEARTRKMKVWILDDAHFPTGYANGQLAQEEDSLCKQYLAYNSVDVYGPISEASLHVEPLTHYYPSIGEAPNPIFAEKNPRVFHDDSLYAVVAAKLMDGDRISAQTVVLTDQVKDGWLRWDVPEGPWRIFVVYKTRNGGGKTNYINMLDPKSCQLQIQTVYEPHYQRYKKDFGTTLAGFFSDEPAVGNTIGFDFNESIGRRKMHLPWAPDMEQMMTGRLGDGFIQHLPALWMAMDDEATAGRVRYGYMDAATALISRSFSQQLGAWCSAHGVEYIGHIVEDCNQHSRLGCGMGHFFRAMQGQHMSGIDDIGNQVMIGGDDVRRPDGFSKGGQGEFFHFELGKLGSSLAHIDPKKKGRAMCEIFGAYGWHTGVRTMKYLADHFLVRGINVFVPHAFSPKAFPDPDAPPHFYAHGENPQYRHFGKLMGYMNRMCHIFNHGKAVTPVAMLYHAEAEWSGGYMFNQKPARQLMEHQIDFDIVPSDVFAHMEEFNASFGPVPEETVPRGAAFGNVLQINGQTYGALVVPYAQYITRAVAEFCTCAARSGFPVVFVDGLPQGICDLPSGQTATELTDALTSCTVVSLDTLGQWLRDTGIFEITASLPFRRLRAYHYVHDNIHAYMFFNEDPAKSFDGDVAVAAQGSPCGYDAMENTLYGIDSTQTGQGTQFHLHLGPCESAVLLFDPSVGSLPPRVFNCGQTHALRLGGPWQVSLCEATLYPEFQPLAELEELHDIGRLAPGFSGFIRYEAQFNLEDLPLSPLPLLLSLENAYEGVEVWINEIPVGMCICPPYVFPITEAVKPGVNTLRVEVATTLYRKIRSMGDGSVSFGNPLVVMEPMGIIGQVQILY